MKFWLDSNFTLTKRHLGILVIFFGALALISVFLFDAIGLSDPEGGFGPSQKAGVALSIFTILIGITLLPLGDNPA